MNRLSRNKKRYHQHAKKAGDPNRSAADKIRRKLKQLKWNLTRLQRSGPGEIVVTGWAYGFEGDRQVNVGIDYFVQNGKITRAEAFSRNRRKRAKLSPEGPQAFQRYFPKTAASQKRITIRVQGRMEEPDMAYGRRFKREADREIRLMAQEDLIGPGEKRELRRIILEAHAEYLAGRSNKRTLNYILNEVIPDFGEPLESADSPTSREREWSR